MTLRHLFHPGQARWIGAIGVTLLAFYPSPTLAQIAGDGTLGTQVNGSAIAPCTGVCNINGGTTRGVNLYHSFRVFSLPTGGQASFINAAPIQNILVRVTGNAVSNLDGVLSANGTANLFLLNPNGIVFGRNARLNLRGSFVASTANSVQFADGLEFNTVATATPPLLTISVPIGLNFTGKPSSIVVQGNGLGSRRSDAPAVDTNIALRVPIDRTLALIGGDLLLEGATLKTAGGRIELGSVAASGVVRLAPSPRGFAFSYQGAPTLGSIQLTRATAVDATGDRGGEIQLQGRQITLQGGSQIEASTLRTAAGGSLQVFASDLVEVSGTTADNPQDSRRFPSSLSADNRQGGQIPGELTINTQRLVVRNGARISASTSANGVGGNLTVNAADSVELVGTGTAAGGLRSSGLSVQTRGSGNAGSLTINTPQLLVQSGAEVSASTFGAGNGGNLTVNAADITVVGTSPNQVLRSRVVAEVGNPSEITNQQGQTSQIPATGRGGDLTINTQQLRVSDGAIVAVSSRTDANGAQGAGGINVTAQTIQLDNRGAIVAESRTGQGGNIHLQVRDLFFLRHNSLLSTTAGTAQAGGDGGNITINSKFVLAVRSENSDITANAFTGNGGRVDVTTQGIYGLQFQPKLTPLSDITASSQFGVNGTVNLNVLNLDPSRGLVALPVNLTDPSQQISQSCTPSDKAAASSFVSTGRGGLPLNPDEPLESRAVVTRWVALPEEAGRQGEQGRQGKRREQENGRDSNNQPLTVSSPAPIVEAQGMVMGSDGIVALVANPATGDRANVLTASVPCPITQGTER